MLASFFVGYLIFQVPSGRLASRFGGRYVMAAAIIWWSLFTLLTPLAAMISLPLLLLVRISMGLGEAATFPAAYNLGARWFPPAERSRFVGVLLSGIPAGTLFALMTTGAIVRAWNWPVVFYLFGSIGILLALVWIALIRNSPAEHPRISAAERDLLEQGGAAVRGFKVTPWGKLLSQPAVWALIFNHFCCNWILYVLLTWLPSYFTQTQHLSLINADPRFQSPMDRIRNYAVLAPLLGAVIVRKPRAYWERAFTDHDIPFAPVHSIADVIADPQVQHLGTFGEAEHQQEGRIVGIRNPLRINGARCDVVAPPVLGEHGDLLRRH